MLPQDLQEGLLDLGGVDLHATLEHLLHLLLIELHEFDIRVAVDGLELVVDDLVVAVDTVDVLEEAVEDGLRGRNLRVDQQGSAEVNSSLHQVLCAEVVLGIPANIVSTEGGLHSVDGWVHLEFVKEGHSSSGLLGLLVAEAGVVVDEKGADV